MCVQDSLEGNAKTMIIANVKPCHMCAQSLHSSTTTSNANAVQDSLGGNAKPMINANADLLNVCQDETKIQRLGVMCVGLIRREC